MTKLNNRSYIRIISYAIFALIVLVTLAVTGIRNATTYKNQLELGYQQSLTELGECLESVNTDLTKSLYSNSYGEIYDLSRDLYAQCSTAKNAISRLPIKQMELGNAYKFLSQASDYAQYIGTRIENGERISDDEHEALKKLLDYSQKFNDKTEKMVAMVEAGAKITNNEIKSDSPINVSALSSSFSTSAKTFDDFPTLLYDGPFSDQVMNKSSRLIKQAKVYTKSDCRRFAAQALDVPLSRVNFEADEQGKIPCYAYTCGRYVISVTKQGGYIREIIYSGTIDDKSISIKNACNLAKDYLDKLGYKDMAFSYYNIENNICTVNMAYEKSGVVCYSDLIKVGVSMSDGKIVSLDASTYLTNHITRVIKAPKISKKDAMAKVSKYLKPISARECIIPKESGKEVQCYEVLCQSKDTGEKALVYINTDNGNEEDIMLMLETDNGSLVK